jgi:hypothetical protein
VSDPDRLLKELLGAWSAGRKLGSVVGWLSCHGGHPMGWPCAARAGACVGQLLFEFPGHSRACD